MATTATTPQFKVGDKVKIIKPESPRVSWNADGAMDKYIGHTLVIKKFYSNDTIDYEHYLFSLDCLELVEKVKEKPITKITKKIFVDFVVKSFGGDTRLQSRKNSLVREKASLENAEKIIKTAKDKGLIALLKGTFLNNEFEYRYKGAESDVRRAKSNIETLEKQIKISEDTAKEFDASSAELMLTQLKKHKQVDKIGYNAEDNEILILTTMLKYENKQTGRMLIVIKPNGYYIFNTDYTTSRSYDLWCIESGRICEGDWSSGLQDLLISKNLYFLVAMILQICHTNTNGGYTSTLSWLESRRKINDFVYPRELVDKNQIK